MEEGFFKYEVFYWDEVEKKETVNKGITYADSYKNAVDNIEKYYGNNCIISLNIQLEELGPCYELEGE